MFDITLKECKMVEEKKGSTIHELRLMKKKHTDYEIIKNKKGFPFCKG